MKGKCCRSCGCSKRGSGNAGGMGSGERNGVREVGDDTPPPNTKFTCAQQAAWGKCSKSWMKGKCCRSCGCSKRGSGNAGGSKAGSAGGMGSGERMGVREINPGQGGIGKVNTGKSECLRCMDEKLALYKREPDRRKEGLMNTFESSQAAAKFACSKLCEKGDKQREEGRKKNEEE